MSRYSGLYRKAADEERMAQRIRKEEYYADDRKVVKELEEAARTLENEAADDVAEADAEAAEETG